MKATRLAIPDVVLLKPEVFGDDRLRGLHYQIQRPWENWDALWHRRCLMRREPSQEFDDVWPMAGRNPQCRKQDTDMDPRWFSHGVVVLTDAAEVLYKRNGRLRDPRTEASYRLK